MKSRRLVSMLGGLVVLLQAFCISPAFAAVPITAVDSGTSSATGQGNVSIVTGTPTAGSAITSAVPQTASAAAITTSGTFVGTLQIEASYDSGVTYVPLSGLLRGGSLTTPVSAFTGNGVVVTGLASATNLRVRASALASGSPQIQIAFSTASTPVTATVGGGTATLSGSLPDTAAGDLAAMRASTGAGATAAKQDVAHIDATNILAKQPAPGTQAAPSADIITTQGKDQRPAATAITAADVGSTTTAGQSSVNLLTGTATTNSTAVIALNGMSSLTATFAAFTGSLSLEASADNGVTWVPTSGLLRGTNLRTSTITGMAVITMDVTSMTHFRVRATAITGSVSPTFAASNAAGMTKVLNGIALVDSGGSDVTDPASHAVKTQPNPATYQLLTNASATGAAVTPAGGNYLLSLTGTFGGATVTVNSTVNGVTTALGAYTAAPSSPCFAIAGGTSVQAVVSGGSPSALYGTLGGVGSGGCAGTVASVTSTPASSSLTGTTAAATITSTSTQILAAQSRKLLVIDNESTTATIACNMGGTAAINTAGSFTITPGITRTWKDYPVPADAVNCISSAATSAATTEQN